MDPQGSNVQHVVTAGNAPDGHPLPALLARDLAQEVPAAIVVADRGYDDGDNYFLLEPKSVFSAIRLNDERTKKKDANREMWQRLEATAQYQQGLEERYKIERKFGEATSPGARPGKTRHGLRRCRYLGLLRYGLQAILVPTVLNLKRMVKLLTGVRSKHPVLVTG